MKTTLMVMAAGMGTRFKGGIKQLEPVGPNGEILTEYAVYDAVKAGFDKVVFIIRKDIEEAFHQAVGSRFDNAVAIEYAYQESDDLPDFAKSLAGRTKPWGTGHAVLAARNIIHEPFAVINADDYYGREAFKIVHKQLMNDPDKGGAMPMCMAGFVLKNTLSANGTVTRGVCRSDDKGRLAELIETYEIGREADGRVFGNQNGVRTEISEDSLVSMNMWGCPERVMGNLKERFDRFLKDGSKDMEKAEFVLPIEIDGMIKAGEAYADVLRTDGRWFGMTRCEDTAEVKDAILGMIKDGVYPEHLWK